MEPFSSEPLSPAAKRRRSEQVVRERDRALAHLAAQQSGVVSRDQLKAIGFSTKQIERRTNRSLWPVNPAVFAVGHPGVTRLARAKGTLLYTGLASGLSHQSAARVWGMVGRATDGPIHVSVLDRANPVVPPRVVIHRPTNLVESDLVDHKGLRLTTPERTLIDRLPHCSTAEITRMLEQMVTHLDRSPDDLHAWAHDLGRVEGRSKLIRALDEVAGPAVIRSELEALFRTVCQEGGLPPATTNYRMGRWEIDAVWLRYRVAVELDSYRYHGGKWQFYRDRRKGLAISAAGFELLRITWPQLKHERPQVIEAIRYALDRGAARMPQPTGLDQQLAA